MFGAHWLFLLGWPAWWPALLLVLVAAALRAPLAAALAIGLAWGEQALEARRADRLDPALSGARLEISGRVHGLPERYGEGTRFRFRPDVAGAPPGLPKLLLISWYRDPPALAPGEEWRLRVRVRPPWAEVNFHGADRERWYYAEGIGALATVQSGTRLAGEPRGAPWHRWRDRVRDRLDTIVPDPARRGILLALAIADRSLLDGADRQTLASTGTAHLLAISGLHVGLAALWGFWIGRLALLAIPVRRGGARCYPLCLLAGAVTACVYAALAGFGTSTVRALVMLVVALLTLTLRRTVDAGRAWLLALAVILLIDPLAPLRAGFWLSFAAVAVLLMLFAPRRGQTGGFCRGLMTAQAGIMLVTLPLSAWWFQLASPAGFIANLAAIPWVSFVVVPLTLAGLALLPFGDVFATPVFGLAGAAADALCGALEWLARIPGARLGLPQPSFPAMLTATAGALAWLLPRGVPLRPLGLVLLLPLALATPPPAGGGARLDVLDTGQGTALLLTADDRLLLYDSGPGDGMRFDRVDTVIAPAVRQAGHAAPERIIVSHADLDHAGGLPALQQRYTGTPVHARLPHPRPGVGPCDDDLAWNWPATRFAVLHPSRWLPYVGNDASCVLSARGREWSVLLPGDISRTVEQRLVDAGLAPHTVLLVPHHGSATSSSGPLLQAVAPRAAVATAGPGNRFGFPRPEVLARYHAAGIPLWSTGNCGALRLELGPDGSLNAASARRRRTAPWRWPAAPDCP